MVRKTVVLGVLFITLLSFSIAFAGGLRVDGGTLQTFQYTVEVPDSQPTDKARTTWDGSQLEITNQGFECKQGMTVLVVEVRNAGEAMQGSSTWVLLLDKTITAHGELPPLDTQEKVRLEYATGKPGVYTYKIVQRVGHTGAAEVYAVDIVVTVDLCAQPTNQPITATPTPTEQATNVITIEPTAALETPAPTDTPAVTATLEAPTPTETPTPEPPTPTATYTPSPPTPEPPAPEPPVTDPPTQEPTSAPDILPTDPPTP